MFKRTLLFIIASVLTVVLCTLGVFAVDSPTANAASEKAVTNEMNAPKKVETFKAVSKGSYIQLSWTPVSGADGYLINCSGNGIKNKKIIIEDGKKDKYRVNVKVKDVKRYTFIIRAYKNNGTTRSYSAETTKAYVPAISLNVKAATAGTVTLKWTVSKPYKDEGSYKVCKKVGSRYKAVKKKIKVVPSNDGKYMTATFKVTGLGGGKSYTFYIRDENSRAKSNIVTVDTPLANVKDFKALSSHNSVVLSWSNVARATGYTISWAGNGKSGNIIIDKGNTTTYTFPVAANANYSFSIAATKEGYKSSLVRSRCDGESVRTMYYSVMFNTDRTLYSHSGGNVRADFAAGTWITATGYTGGRYIFWYQGRVYYVSRISTSYAKVSHHNVGKSYTIAEAESFVNKLNLYSGTSYLIWVNTYTQKEYIFKGSNGKWKCVITEPWLVSTGAPSSPTESGLTRIGQKDPQEHDSYYWSVCSSYSIHSKPPSQHQPLGWPYAGSCVRNTFDHAKWIYYNCAIGTGVYVF